MRDFSFRDEICFNFFISKSIKIGNVPKTNIVILSEAKNLLFHQFLKEEILWLSASG